MAGHPAYHVNVIKMRGYMDTRVTPPERVTSPTWGPPPPCKRALNLSTTFTLGTEEGDHCKEVAVVERF